MSAPVCLYAVPGIPDIRPGDPLTEILGDALEAAELVPVDGDVLCLAHKIVSKAEGAVVRLAEVTPSEAALDYAQRLNKDPAKVEVVLRESRAVLRAFRHPGRDEGTMICEHRLGFIAANAGVDASNAEEAGTVITLPRDPDASLAALVAGLGARFQARIGAVMTDTFGRPWRLGQVNVAIGLAQVPPTRREQDGPDAWGRPLMVTEPAFADEIAAASGLVIRKAAKTPAVLVRGLDWLPEPRASAQQLLRATKEDMFR